MAYLEPTFKGGIDPSDTGSVYYDSSTTKTKYMDGTGTWVDIDSTGGGTTTVFPHYDVYDTSAANKENPVWEPGKNEDKGGFMLLTLGDFSPFHQVLQFTTSPAISQTITFSDPWNTITTTGTYDGSTMKSADTQVTFV